MKKHSVTFLLLGAALILYAVGLVLPATVLLVLGVLAEGMFWVRLFERPHGNDT